MSKPTVTAIQEKVNVQEFSAAFNSKWYPYMLNGGKADSKSRRRFKREEIYDSLRASHPAELKCLDSYRRAMSREATENGKFGLTTAKLDEIKRTDPHAYVGHEIMKRIASLPPRPKKEKTVNLTANGKKIGRPRKGDIETARTRYMECIKNLGWVPEDHMAAILLGCTAYSIGKIREELSADWQFLGDDGGFIVNPIVKPEPVIEPPSLIDRLMSVLNKLPQDDLKVLEELLEEDKQVA
jgi:hypothetical protein